MSYNARVRTRQNRAGGLYGHDRGWEVGSNQGGAIGIPARLVRKVNEKTTPINYDGNGVKRDDRNLVVQQNTLSGVGRWRSQFNIDADGIVPKRYYLDEEQTAEQPAAELLDFFVTPTNVNYPTPAPGAAYVGVSIPPPVTPSTVTPTAVSKLGITSYVNYLWLKHSVSFDYAALAICCSTDGTCNVPGNGPFNTSSTYTVTITSDGVTESINVDSDWVPVVSPGPASSGYSGPWGQYITINSTSGADAMKALIATIVAGIVPFQITFTEN